MHRITTALSAATLSLGLLLTPAVASAASEAPAAARAAGISAPYYGESPKPIASKLGLKPTGGVKTTKGIRQLVTTTAIITTYPTKSLQNKGAANIQQLATDMSTTFVAVWAKGVMISILDNNPATAAALAKKLPGGSVKTFTP